MRADEELSAINPTRALAEWIDADEENAKSGEAMLDSWMRSAIRRLLYFTRLTAECQMSGESGATEGDTEECEECGEAIVYSGSAWRHESARVGSEWFDTTGHEASTDADEYVMENDDAYDTAQSLIGMARDLIAGRCDGMSGEAE